MTVLEWRHFSGPNVHCHRPMIELFVDLKPYHAVTTREARHLGPQLLELLPGLRTHHCSTGRAGGFCRRMDEGTYIGHVMEHVALELLALSGEAGTYGKTRLFRDPSIYLIAFETEVAENGFEAFELARDLCTELVERHTPDIALRLQDLRRHVGERLLGPSTQALRAEAQRRGIPVRRIGGESLLQLGWGVHRRLVEATLTDRTNVVAVDIAKDKVLTKTILEEAGLPVPPGAVSPDEDTAVALARALGSHVVIKPYDGNQGKGVALALSSEMEVRAAFRVARALSEKVMVERHVPGRQYRVLVVDGEVVAAAERRPALVTGDGRSTIRELVEEANRDPHRGFEHERPLTRMAIDPLAVLCLARQGYTPDSVPGANEVVLLRESANLSTGGTAADVSPEIGSPLRQDCVRAAQAIGLDVCGIDIVTDDIGSALAGHGAVIELNAAPGIRMHHYPSEGQPRNVAKAILDRMFPDGDGRIPVIAVTGTNGKTTTTRLITHLMAQTGRRVGMTTTDGVYIGGNLVVPGDNTGPRSARVVLSDPTVEAAVLECARGGLRRGGLAYDRADIGVFLNLTGDHLGQDGIDNMEALCHLKSLIVEAVRPDGAAILNADDPFVLGCLNRVRCRAFLFGLSLQSLGLQRHLRDGGHVVSLKAGHIVHLHQGHEERVIPLCGLRFAMAGRARLMVENALAAVAAAFAAGLPAAAIAHGLESFDGGPLQNPGRLNIYDVGGVRVVVDYGHNSGALEAVFRTLRDLRPDRLIGVVGMPGDRRDEDARALGAICATALDLVIVKEDHDLRGRASGELANLIADGVRSAGGADGRLHTVLDECEALRFAILQARMEDMVVVFYEKLAPILGVIEEMRVSRARLTAEAEPMVGQRR